MYVDRGAYSKGYVFRGVPRGALEQVVGEFYDDTAAMIADQDNQVRGGMYKASTAYYILAAETFTGAIEDYDELGA
jgi:hypothetical protein